MGRPYGIIIDEILAYIDISNHYDALIDENNMKPSLPWFSRQRKDAEDDESC